MAFEIIREIVEAEKEADSIKLKAADDSEQIKNNAAAQAKKMLEDAKKQAQAQQQRLVDEAVEKGRQEAEKIIAAANDECLRVKDAAMSKKDAAVKAVIGKVVGINGDS